MGTNFYMHTKDKAMACRFAPHDFEITDEPEFGYQFHVAKTSFGWLPLFQGHDDGINSVNQYKEAYDCGCKILDEYGRQYSWKDFTERVLRFNGGTVYNRKIIKVDIEKRSKPLYDKDVPAHVPISHFEYANGAYSNYYFTDNNGYEFDTRDFC